MRVLGFIFAAMVVYGLVIGHIGGALIALCMLGFIYYANRVFKQQDAAWRADPRNASNPRCTLHDLDEACVECSTPKDLR